MASCAPLEILIAAAADLCCKPWLHAVVSAEDATPEDYCCRIECRDADGIRLERNDLELELYQSGSDLNLTLSWADQPTRPILWHGQHPVWMNGETGERCTAPNDGGSLEALARRLRALLA
ncbi:hypothetical protein [Synechococcus sp. CS-197]|uniref:hypothetical protein n=1 Tax=Synechococcus sp. CS-197 TaxID=2847985 RepID=UPI00015254FF|nr:hypothetical protein [Synechococcus sp. CS-197]MCT0252145.1 hypothetical protein [Synechococcus sp. CS-197]PTT97284.1 hypothetical protein DBR45_39285 [Pseudomonas sp. HMWF031]CAK23720.1 Conserved hypothetical protein [Synechococcus sp. WH 7803]